MRASPRRKRALPSTDSTPSAMRCASHLGAFARPSPSARRMTSGACACRSLEDGTTASYRVHLHEDASKKAGPCLSYWCMVPGTCMQELQRTGVRSIVLTSGTLSPMESFAHELVRARSCFDAPSACLTDALRLSSCPSPSAWRTRTSFHRRRRVVVCAATRPNKTAHAICRCGLARSTGAPPGAR